MDASATRTSRRGRRPGVTAGLFVVVLAILSALLIVDTVRLPQTRVTARWVTAHRLVDVAASIERARAVNPVIAMAAREAGGETAVLELPENHRDLLAREPDLFNWQPVPTLNRNLISPFIGERVRIASYEPVLSADQAASIESDPRTTEFPMDVWFLEPEGGAERVRLYTDPARLRIYVVPSDLFAEGGS